MYRVCLVDDDPNSQELIVHWMQRCKRLELVGVYRIGRKALRELPKVKPDVVLLDIEVHGMSGVECVTRLRHSSPPFKSPVLMLAEEEDLIFEAFKAGADGYLLKRHLGPRELQTAIVEVMAAGAPMSPSVARKMITYFQNIQRRSRSSCHWPSLTIRENEVICCFSKGLLYKETADALKISYSAVHKYQHNAFRKLHVTNRSEAIRRWWGIK